VPAHLRHEHDLGECDAARAAHAPRRAPPAASTAPMTACRFRPGHRRSSRRVWPFQRDRRYCSHEEQAASLPPATNGDGRLPARCRRRRQRCGRPGQRREVDGHVVGGAGSMMTSAPRPFGKTLDLALSRSPCCERLFGAQSLDGPGHRPGWRPSPARAHPGSGPICTAALRIPRAPGRARSHPAAPRPGGPGHSDVGKTSANGGRLLKGQRGRLGDGLGLRDDGVVRIAGPATHPSP